MPTVLSFGTWVLPTADLGPPAAVSMLQPPPEMSADTLDVVDARMADWLTRGRLPTTLPYVRQSGYDRELRARAHPVAILAGDRLRATFLLDLGGRLWSLVDMATGQDLLYTNKAIQFANLAIRDAWFAGGVEWNVGLIGHTPLTCSPLHAARVDSDLGPVLRLWEYDRLRECVYRVDAWMDKTTGLLCVRPEIRNPNPTRVDTYWWSNMAVPLTEATRVLVPAESAWLFGFEKVMRKVPVSGPDEVWPARAVGSADYFFDLEGRERPWIAAVEPDGRGLVQTSSALLEGRKLFVWGTASGGKHWQEWLSPLGGQYLEIQAGLARTQMEHVPLAAGASHHWVETYGPANLEPRVARSADFAEACAGVEAAIQRDQSNAWFAEVERAAEAMAALPPGLVQHRGSGWGALECARREADGEAPLASAATPFPDDTLGGEQEPWLALLRRGVFPAANPTSAPGSYQHTAGWARRLTAGRGWRACLHLGEIRWHAGNTVGARQAWTSSVEAAPNPWAWRDLGVAAVSRGDLLGAAEAYARASALAPDELDIACERFEVLLASGRARAALQVIDALPPRLQSDPRVRLAEARAALAAGSLERALQALAPPLPVPPTIREGDNVLDVLWGNLQDALAHAPASPLVDKWRAKKPGLPREWDFRMAPPGEGEGGR